LFGIAIVSGRPLTLHECVLPQTARSMHADGDFVIPKINGQSPDRAATAMPSEPWLESPPLPQWITVLLATPFGRCDSEAIVRIGPTLVGTYVVLLTAWMAALWFGRSIGLLAGLVLSTTLEFTRYGWLAEDEIYLTRSWWGFILATLFGSRSRWVTAFFLMMGATNLVKGLAFGTVMASIPLAAFLVLCGQPRRIARYVWVWGVMLFLAVAFAWPLAAYSRYPDAFDVWYFDLFGRLGGSYKEINEPIWYYPVNLLWMLMPWTFFIPLGMAVTRTAAWRDRTSPERFLWCWALLVPAVFSIPGGKHHHYLLHAMAPWAVLGALGIREFRLRVTSWPTWMTHPATSAVGYGVPAAIAIGLFESRIPGPGWLPIALMVAVPVIAGLIAWSIIDRAAWRAGTVAFAVLLGCYAGGHFYAARHIDSNRHDVAFLKSVRQRVDSEKLPILIDMSANSFHGMMGLFYMPDDAALLHNPSFLGAAEITAPEVFVVAMASLADEIGSFGTVEALETSRRVPRARTAKDKLTLFRLKFDPSVVRIPARNIRVTPMQAMNRVAGPYLDLQIADRPEVRSPIK
jgi:4-amino-4-deoxy-L-arabinose transferase-like glycosyltransferase